MKTRMKPLRLFVPITRVDAEQRLVEGYCYVNAEVGDGVNLSKTPGRWRRAGRSPGTSRRSSS